MSTTDILLCGKAFGSLFLCVCMHACGFTLGEHLAPRGRHCWHYSEEAGNTKLCYTLESIGENRWGPLTL